jgi:hypothetical protein
MYVFSRSLGIDRSVFSGQPVFIASSSTVRAMPLRRYDSSIKAKRLPPQLGGVP